MNIMGIIKTLIKRKEKHIKLKHPCLIDKNKRIFYPGETASWDSFMQEEDNKEKNSE